MKKIDLWLVCAFALSAFVDPDNSSLFVLGVVYSNLLLAILSKYISVEKDKK